NGGVRSAIGAVLHDAVILLGGAHHLPAFPPEMRARLFDVDVLARLAGPDRHQRMPVIRRGDRNGVDGFVFHDAARIGIDLGLGHAQALHVRQPLAHDVVIDIAYRRHLHVFEARVLFDVREALAANAADRYSDSIVCTSHLLPPGLLGYHTDAAR